MHPFDIKATLLAKHAQHVVLIHFPIALFIAGVVFDFLAQWKKNRLLLAAAQCNFFVSAFMTVPVLISGILAWQWQLEGQRLKGILLMHLILGSSSSVLIWVVWVIHRKTERELGSVSPRYLVPLEVLAALLVAFTGHLGGFLSGVNGPG